MKSIKVTFLILSIFCLFFLFSCAKDGDDTNEDSTVDDDQAVNDDDSSSIDDDLTNDDDTAADDDDDPVCDPTTRPIVFVHGFLAAADTYANHSMRFASNGYCLDRVFAYDWNTLSYNFIAETEKLSQFIDWILTTTGANQIDLAGHSAGAGLSAFYLNQDGNAAKVAHYAQLAGFSLPAPPGGVPTINLSSPDDYIAGSSEIPGATNVSLVGHDHYQVATSSESFIEIFRFFTDGEEPFTDEIVPSDTISLSGRVITLGENQPQIDMSVKIFSVSEETGERMDGIPVGEFLTNNQGFWGPFNADPATYYEFYVEKPGSDVIAAHYYREPFVRSNDLVYMRMLPAENSLAGALLGFLDFTDDHAVPVSFTANQAVIAGRDTFQAGGYDLATEEMAPPEKTTIAIFYFDANDNGLSDGIPAGGIFDFFPFLGGFDLYVDTQTQRVIPFEFNGRTLHARNWKSASEGFSVVVFE